ncbi:PREDICTED: SLAM family member 9 [Gekko japonicus]|uniref:SLAM family member 9 n=1 Tax=Gekko japonicus TaxID=146911 RepID=A0ABM1LGG4_GEKJA|nr:PREDICTED: SLAM family member 9 [Gekko japonicus]
MDVCSPLSPILWALVLQAARLAPAELTPNQDLIYQAGDEATLSLEVPRGSNISNLLWRSSSRGSMGAVATWDPEFSLNVLDPSYSGRVTFRKESWALGIRNLSTADGGRYEVLERREPSDLLLKKYTLAVFRIEATASHLADGSCSVSLLCEAGVGARTQVEYSWGPGHPGSALQLTLRPDEKDKSYTCTATALGTRYSHKVTPYEACSSATRAAGLLAPALLLALLLLLQ